MPTIHMFDELFVLVVSLVIGDPCSHKRCTWDTRHVSPSELVSELSWQCFNPLCEVRLKIAT